MYFTSSFLHSYSRSHLLSYPVIFCHIFHLLSSSLLFSSHPTYFNHFPLLTCGCSAVASPILAAGRKRFGGTKTHLLKNIFHPLFTPGSLILPPNRGNFPPFDPCKARPHIKSKIWKLNLHNNCNCASVSQGTKYLSESVAEGLFGSLSSSSP